MYVTVILNLFISSTEKRKTIYSNENVRRQDHLLDEESVRNLLAKCEYRVLSMVNDEGGITHCTTTIDISIETTLRLLFQKYSSNYMEVGMQYAERSFARTEIIHLQISTFSSKSNRIKA